MGSMDSVGTSARELNFDSSTPSSSTTTSLVNASPNNDGNNNEHSTQNDRRTPSNSPIDTENGNNADPSVNSGCTSNGKYTTGNGSNASSKQPNHINYSNNGSPLHSMCGGRLQFFKDGKFILELARAKEGDRGWISVPRKTYWPPAALSQNNLNNHKHESSTSLSFSDDNSSIQSSPWQRDHSWKQSTPRKNISKDLNLHYYRPVALVLTESSKSTSKHLRRQPFKKTYHVNGQVYVKLDSQSSPKAKEEGIDDQVKERLNDKGENDTDTVDSSNGTDGKSNDDEDEKMDYKNDDESNSKVASETDDKIEKPTKSPIGCRKKRILRTSKLSSVIEKLITKVSEKPVNVSSTQTGLGIHFSAASRSNDLIHPHQHLTPRKRFLREFEKVSLEDRSSTSLKRSRSKSNASTDMAVSNSKPGANYSIVVAQHTANIACNSKEENRIANGSPSKSSISPDVPESKSSAPAGVKNNHTHASSESSPQPPSKPISNYSIISLLGHKNSESRGDDDKHMSENRGSPRSPISYNNQTMSNSRSSYATKKKSPTSSRTLINSPTNYRNAPSPDLNSPSPGLNSHHSRYHSASLSSPTSSFHPYLSSSRASPLSSGTLSPTDLCRHRSYRTAASPSTMSNSSGLTHPYASLNGSPIGHRYSPHSSSTKTSPTQSSHNLSSAYNVSNLLPHTYDAAAGDRYSPKHRASDWSPARNVPASGRGSPSNSNNSLSTTTIPKKTASIRQKYGSLSPNGFIYGSNCDNASSTKIDSAKKAAGEGTPDAKSAIKRSKSPTELPKKTQSQEMYEKDLQARYNAEVAAMHHQQSMIASALQQQAASPFYQMYGAAGLHGANLPPSMAAAYMNPMYYPHSELFRKSHASPMDFMHKNLMPSPWVDPYNAPMMHFSGMAGAALIADKATMPAKPPNDIHSMLMPPYHLGRPVPGRDQQSAAEVEMWNADVKKSAVTAPGIASAFRQRPQQSNDCEPISLIKDEPSSDVPLNLSKH